MKIDGQNDGLFLRTMNCGCYGCIMIVVFIVAMFILAAIFGHYSNQ